MVALRFWAFFCGFLCLLKLGKSTESVDNIVKLSEVSASWSNCGTDDSFVVTNYFLPSVITIPGPVTFLLTALIKEQIHAPVQIQVEVKKNVWGFWIEVPCVDHIGSCTYNNVCEWLNHNFSKNCPFGLTSCQCPVKQGEINIPETTFELTKLKLPDFLSDGTYKITIKSTSGDQHIACFTTTVTLQTESSSSGWLLGKQ